MRVSYIRISNNAHRAVYLWPKDEELRKQWGLVIKPGDYLIMDFALQKYTLELDDCFFQFEGLKRQIKPKNISKHKVEVDCWA